MNITFFNANASEENPFLDDLVREVGNQLDEHHTFNIIELRKLNLNYCHGCWGCWVKEPGRCVIKDDIELVQRAFISSDLVVFAARMKMGFPEALMKKMNDRLIPLVHPYIELVDGECHHKMRYDQYPAWGLILQEEQGGTKEDVDLVKEIYSRTALNIKSKLLFTSTTVQTPEEIAYEIDHL